MKLSKKFTEESELVAVRLPKILKSKANQYCEREDLTFSQLMRRAIKREVNQPITSLNEESV